MPEKSALPRLADILDAITGIRETVMGLDQAAFAASWTALRAVERGVEIISEASRHIPADLKDNHPEIPWAKIAGIGNITRHEYHRVAPDIVWRIVEAELGPLEAAISEMRAELEG